MPSYKYRAKKGPQDIIEGRIEAQSEKEAIEKLSQLNYLPLKIEAQSPAPKAQKQPSPLSIMRRKVKAKEITLFSRELSSLLKAGVPILKALDIIAEQSESRHLRHILQSIRSSVKEGSTFSGALTQYPLAFPSLFIALVRTGENSGALPQALLRVAEYRAKQEETLTRLRMSLAYPALMAIVGIATVIFMFVFVMPRLTSLYLNMGQELPVATRILIAISNGLRQNGFWIVVVCACVILLFRRQLKTQAGRVFFSGLQLRIPIIGSFILKAELSRFCHTLELLIKSGIPILKAMDVSIPVLENEVIKTHLRQSSKELEQGGSFGMSLKKTKVFPLFMSNLISVGEESGRLDEALAEVSAAYQRDTNEALGVISSLVEPLMILVMGLIVGFIVVAMMLPIFEINVMIK